MRVDEYICSSMVCTLGKTSACVCDPSHNKRDLGKALSHGGASPGRLRSRMTSLLDGISGALECISSEGSGGLECPRASSLIFWGQAVSQ
jgi:hypothetical protein